MMPGFVEIRRYLFGVWRLMTGHADGLRALDLSVDGFWNSFFAIVVALPALIVSWIAVSRELVAEGAADHHLSIVARLAVVDLASWVIPLGLFALAARPAGIADRFVAYVVANNWATALFSWVMLPPVLLPLLWPQALVPSSAVILILFPVTLVLSWRVTNGALRKGPAVATVVFIAMFAAAFGVTFSLEALFGLKTWAG